MAEAILIEQTKDTPSVAFDPHSGIFEMCGRSLPEDSEQFYMPILKWIKEYAQQPHPLTQLNIKLDYFNTSSEKQLYRILSLLEKIPSPDKVKVKWHYDGRDKDMEMCAQRYSKLTKLNIELISA